MLIFKLNHEKAYKKEIMIILWPNKYVLNNFYIKNYKIYIISSNSITFSK